MYLIKTLIYIDLRVFLVVLLDSKRNLANLLETSRKPLYLNEGGVFYFP
jgi:hypothetical protein